MVSKCPKCGGYKVVEKTYTNDIYVYCNECDWEYNGPNRGEHDNGWRVPVRRNDD